MTTVLIIEDEEEIADFIQKGLESSGFTPTIVSQGTLAIDMILSGEFDMIVLDLGLPDLDGLVILQEIRRQAIQTPVIILSARDDIQDKISAFDLGADDYMTKPFRLEELIIRIRVRLRSSGGSNEHTELLLQFNNIVLDLRTRQARVNDRPIELSAREFRMAEFFLRHPDQVLSREQLLNAVWGYDYDPGSNVVDVYVGYLRKKLGSNCIETIRGMGYRFRPSAQLPSE